MELIEGFSQWLWDGCTDRWQETDNCSAESWWWEEFLKTWDIKCVNPKKIWENMSYITYHKKHPFHRVNTYLHPVIHKLYKNILYSYWASLLDEYIRMFGDLDCCIHSQNWTELIHWPMSRVFKLNTGIVCWTVACCCVHWPATKWVRESFCYPSRDIKNKLTIKTTKVSQILVLWQL